MMALNRRTLIALGILILVLIALFLTSIVCSPARTDSGCSTEERKRLRARLFRAKPVTREQLAGCPQQAGRLRIPGTCTLVIARASTKSRELVISALDAAIELTITTDADGRQLRQRVKLAPGKSEEIFVDKDGGPVVVTCVGGGLCTAVVNDTAR
jgi:hypothetical protein